MSLYTALAALVERAPGANDCACIEAPTMKIRILRFLAEQDRLLHAG